MWLLLILFIALFLAYQYTIIICSTCFKLRNSIHQLDTNSPPPLNIYRNPNNWYQSLVLYFQKPNNLRKILTLIEMESLMKQLEAALSDYDVEKLKNIKLEDDLKAAQDII